MPSPLTDIANQVFLFVTAFKRKAARGTPPPGDALHGEALKLFKDLDQTAQRNPAVAQTWESARRALVYLVDEVMTTTEWEHRGWWDERVLESQVLKNPQKMRGILFFDELAKAKKMAGESAKTESQGASDLLAVFYCCLRFGFEGKFAGQPQEIEREAQELWDLIGGDAPAQARAYFDQAYRYTVEVPPSYEGTLRLATLAAAGVGLIILLFGFRAVLWNELLDELNDAATRAGTFFGA